mmetsp:Transcript_39495/g.91201  ORF Transcript_39495/g.91201 Transcript_39495/m.91201 type:complete len:372 (-) Transcript_39495:78-1193(-)
MVTSPAASEAPLSEGGWPASSDVTWNHLDSASAVGMPLPQAAFPAGFQPVNPYQSLQTGGSDPYVLQISNGIWELQQQQQTNRQWMQQMTMAFQHVFGHGQQSSASPQVAPRRPRNNKAPRPWIEERKRRKQAQSAAAASQAGQGDAGGSIGATEPQYKSDADSSWEMPEVQVEPKGALKKVTEEMDEHRKQLEHVSKVFSALREDMDAAVAQCASEQSALRAYVDKLSLEVGVVKTSLDYERQARTKSMEAMTEKMATKMEEINEQLGQLQRDATANIEAMVEKIATKTELQEMPTKEWVNEQLCKPQTWNLQKSIGFCFMVAMVVVLGTATYVIAMLNALKAQLKAMQTTVERTPNSFASYSLLAYFFA